MPENKDSALRVTSFMKTENCTHGNGNRNVIPDFDSQFKQDNNDGIIADLENLARRTELWG
jgi:hypothetical protein